MRTSIVAGATIILAALIGIIIGHYIVLPALQPQTASVASAGPAVAAPTIAPMANTDPSADEYASCMVEAHQARMLPSESRHTCSLIAAPD